MWLLLLMIITKMEMLLADLEHQEDPPTGQGTALNSAPVRHAWLLEKRALLTQLIGALNAAYNMVRRVIGPPLV